MSEKKKKIILVYDAIFPFIKGGAQKRFYETGRRLAGDGYDVHLFGMKSWEGPDVMKIEGMTLHGICRNYPLYTRSGKRSIYEAFMFGLASLKLWKEDFDIIDCCGFPYFSTFPIRVFAWMRRKPMYSTWHEVWGKRYWNRYLGIWGPFGYLIESITARLPDTIISVSSSTTEALAKELGRKRSVITVTNGIDLGRISAIAPSQERSDVIFAGRLLDYKHADTLIEAVAIAKERIPDISLVIIGDGPERKNLEALAKKVGIGDAVRFLGFLEENEVYAQMSASRILVLPSEREGFGIIVLEANACGLPVITMDYPKNAAKNLISDGENGSIVRADKEALASSVVNWLSSPATASQHKWAEPYDWDVIMRKANNIYFS